MFANLVCFWFLFYIFVLATCARLSWSHWSFWVHVKLRYRIVSYHMRLDSIQRPWRYVNLLTTYFVVQLRNIFTCLNSTKCNEKRISVLSEPVRLVHLNNGRFEHATVPTAVFGSVHKVRSNRRANSGCSRERYHDHPRRLIAIINDRFVQ